MHKFLSLFMITVSCAALAACGGDSDDDDGGGTGQASVGVTDAPVDNANHVFVEFTAVELKPAEGESQLFELDAPQQIDLLALQGSEFEPLIQNETVPAGQYNWIRLHMNDNTCNASITGDNPSGSYIELNNGDREPLFIPSGNQSGLKLVSGFTIAAGGQTDLVVDFDVRKSVTDPEGRPCHFLKPALRLVDNAEVGHISGTVDSSLLVGEDCSDADPMTGNAVYLFEGPDAVTDDIDGTEPEPVTTSLVTLNESTGDYEYEIGFVLADTHTVAFSCNADLDDPEADNPEVTFEAQQNVVVEAETTKTADF